MPDSYVCLNAIFGTGYYCCDKYLSSGKGRCSSERPKAKIIDDRSAECPFAPRDRLKDISVAYCCGNARQRRTADRKRQRLFLRCQNWRSSSLDSKMSVSAAGALALKNK